MANSIFRVDGSELGEGESFVSSQPSGSGALAVFSQKEFFQQHLGAITQGVLKTWNGSSWVSKPIKTYLGGSFQVKPVKLWNGTTWITLT